MNAFKIAALGLVLAATAAEAQKAPAGQTGSGAKPAPTAEAPTTAPEAGATAAPEAEPAAAAPSAGGLILASDPQGVASAMQALGYTATLGTDGAGDPTITGELEGTPYNVYFFGCQENANCQWLIFSAGFDLPSGSTLDAVNTWNQNNLVGQAYLDPEQDPFLNYFVTTTGGLTQDNFADVVDWWKVALGNFEDAIGLPK